MRPILHADFLQTFLQTYLQTFLQTCSRLFGPPTPSGSPALHRSWAGDDAPIARPSGHPTGPRPLRSVRPRCSTSTRFPARFVPAFSRWLCGVTGGVSCRRYPR